MIFDTYGEVELADDEEREVLRRLNIDPATYRRGHPPIAIECAGSVGDLVTIKATNTQTAQTIFISALRTDEL